MPRWFRFGLVVFLATFLVNLGVVALWPDSEVDIATAATVALVTSVVLTLAETRSANRQDPGL